MDTAMSMWLVSAPPDLWHYRADMVSKPGRRVLRDDPNSVAWHLPSGYQVNPRDAGMHLDWDDHLQVLTVTRPDPVEETWRVIELVEEGAYHLHPRGSLPGMGPGILYVRKSDSAQIAVVMAPSLNAAVDALGWRPGDVRPDAIYCKGPLDVLRDRSVILQTPGSALRSGRPLHIRSAHDLRTRVPHAAGIYRIHRLAPDGFREVYVGQAVDLRRRLSGHEKVRSWGWPTNGDGSGGIQYISILPVREGAVTLVDLDEAEAHHVAKARQRQAGGGPRVVNVTRGVNGRKGPVDPCLHLGG